MDENVELFDLIDLFNEDMYVWILNPNVSPESKRFLLSKLLQNNNTTFGISTGASNDYIISVEGTPDSYSAGQVFYFVSDFTNTGSATIDINSAGQKIITDRSGQPLASGAIQDESFNVIGYDGTKFQLLVNVGGGDTDITKESLQNASFSFAIDTGAADAYIIDLDPSITSYQLGQFFLFKAVNSNTGSSTIEVNGQGGKDLVRRDGTPLQADDISANSYNLIGYDGVEFQLLSSGAGGGGGGLTQSDIEHLLSFFISSDSPTSIWKDFEGHIEIITASLYRNQKISGEDWQVSTDGGGTVLATLVDIVALKTWVDANINLATTVWQVRLSSANFGIEIGTGSVNWKYKFS